MPKQKRIFSLSQNNKGLACPFKPTPYPCQKGFCSDCQIYLDWLKLGEMIVICAWCGEVKSRKPNPGHPVVSHGICVECKAKYFSELKEPLSGVSLWNVR